MPEWRPASTNPPDPDQHPTIEVRDIPPDDMPDYVAEFLYPEEDQVLRANHWGLWFDGAAGLSSPPQWLNDEGLPDTFTHWRPKAS